MLLGHALASVPNVRKEFIHWANECRSVKDIQWVRPYLGLTNKQLQPLYDILPGATALDSERVLTEEGREALKLVEKAIQIAALKRREVDLPISLCILPSENQPTAALWQGAPLLWIHPKFPLPKCILLSILPRLPNWHCWVYSNACSILAPLLMKLLYHMIVDKLKCCLPL